MNFIHLHCSDIYMYVCKKLYIHKLAARIYIYIFLFKFHIDGSTFFSLCFYTPFTRIHDLSRALFILKQTLKRKKIFTGKIPLLMKDLKSLQPAWVSPLFCIKYSIWLTGCHRV
jgi:hypothetical protein